MSITRIPEIKVPGKPLGRHQDDRLSSIRSAGGPPPLASKIVSVTHASGPNMPLNQGEVGSCTLESLVGACNTVPHWSAGKPVLSQADAYAGYSVEQQLMGYGPYPPNDNGGTGVYSCEAGEKMGWLNSYQVAVGVDEWLRALVIRPITIGINWFTSFDTCDPYSGIVQLTPGATVRGGHQVCAYGIDAVNELAWCWQSWGLGWGFHNSGRFAIPFSVLETLESQGGDSVVPRTAAGWVA